MALVAGMIGFVALLPAGPAATQPERPAAVAAGGGEYVLPEADRMGDAERAEIEAMRVISPTTKGSSSTKKKRS